MKNPVQLGIVGLGRQGQRYVETAREMGIELRQVREGIDGVIIATPPDSHVELAREILSRGVPVMVEKPVALSYGEANHLGIFQTPILVDHTHLFAPAFEKLKELLDGPIVRIDVAHYGPGPARDYSGLYDYGPHGVAMCLDLVGGPAPNVVRAGKSGDLFDVALEWDPGHSISVIRRFFLCVGSGAEEKRCWMRVQTRREVGPISRRSGTIFEYDGLRGKLYVDGVEQEIADKRTPLNKAVGVFVGAITGQRDHRLGMKLPLQVMRVLDAAKEMCG